MLNFVLTFALNVILLFTFWDLGGKSYQGIQNRTGFLFIVVVVVFFTAINATAITISPQKLIYIKDQHSKLYRPGTFFFASILYPLPFFIFIHTLIAIMLFYGVGLNDNPSMNVFWFWYFLNFGTYFAGSAIGSIVGVLMPDQTAITTSIPIFAIPMVLLSGAFASVKNMIWPLFLLSYLDPLRFVFQGFILTEFNNSQEYIDNCEFPPEVSNLCDPFQFHDFYEKEKYINVIISLITIIWVLYMVGFLTFMMKYRDKNTVYGYNTKIINKHKTIY